MVGKVRVAGKVKSRVTVDVSNPKAVQAVWEDASKTTAAEARAITRRQVNSQKQDHD
jgi:hypothetical protein